MTSRDAVWRQIEALRAAATPHCTVTVVRTADATSAKAGAKALVTENGELHGFVGGACVRGSVLRVAREVMASGEPRLISVQPRDSVQGEADDRGIELHGSSCPSGGTVDLFIEPFVARTKLVVLGASPVATAIAALGNAIGYAVELAEPSADIDTSVLAARDAVVVATQGRGDRAALVAALNSAAGYVAMVGSRRKVATLREQIAGDIAPERLAMVRGPAGIDIGAIEPEEIALSILAEVVAFRRNGSIGQP